MKQLIISLTVLAVAMLGISAASFAQSKKTTGLRWDDAAYSTIPKLSNFKGSRFDEVDLPVAISLKDYCPVPGNQGPIGSCVSWATGYGAYTIEAAIQNKWTNKSEITAAAFSALFIYNNTKVGGCGDGSRINDAAEFLQTTGDVYFSDFNPGDCNTMPNPDLISKAMDFKIKDYSTLFSYNETDNQEKINKVKESLNQKHPVVIGMNVTDGFMNARGVETWDPSISPSYVGGHAMCIIGYDDTKEAFELLNSWGQDWGSKGFIWVKYDDFTANTRYALQIYAREVPEPGEDDNQDDQPEVNLSGSFYFKKVVSATDFQSQKTNRVGNYYELEKKDFKPGAMFQLVAQSKTEDNYMYVFSLDEVKKVQSHFPKMTGSYKLDESPIVPDESAEVIIPGPQKALKIAQAGTDYLCILYSDTEISNYKEIMENIKSAVSNGTDFYESLKSQLGKRLIPAGDIRYENSMMNFSATSRKGNIVPIILKVQSVK